MTARVLLLGTIAFVAACQSPEKFTADSRFANLKSVLYFDSSDGATRGLAYDLVLRIENKSRSEVRFYDVYGDKSGVGGSIFDRPLDWDLPLDFEVDGHPDFSGQPSDSILTTRVLAGGESIVIPLAQSINRAGIDRLASLYKRPIRVRVLFAVDSAVFGGKPVLRSNEVTVVVEKHVAKLKHPGELVWVQKACAGCHFGNYRLGKDEIARKKLTFPIHPQPKGKPFQYLGGITKERLTQKLPRRSPAPIILITAQQFKDLQAYLETIRREK